MRFLLRLQIISIYATLMVLGGCANTQPTNFYVLSSLSNSNVEKVQSANQGIALGIGPVELPKYLDRPQIVTRASSNQLELADFDQWAGPLKDNVPKVLAENLSILIPTDQIAVYPWNRSTPIDYRVVVEITRFESTTDGKTFLVARWNILGKDGKKILLSKKSSFSEIAKTQDYKAKVFAMNRTLEDLSREIAKAIKTLSR